MSTRREFITLLGGAATRPLTAHAQTRRKPARIGYLGPSSASLERQFMDAFREKLRELGDSEGESILIDYRWAEGEDNRLPVLASELVRSAPDIIVTLGTPGTLAAKRATNTIPIVFASSGNPVNAGLVSSFARPGGNVTGFTVSGPELEGKRVQLLKDVFPLLSRFAVIWNPANPGAVEFYQQVRAAAATLALEVEPVVEVRHADDFNGAFSTIVAVKPQALVVIADRFLLAHRLQITEFAATNRLPAIYPFRTYADAGGLMSYAANDIDQFHRTAVYVHKILNGANPAELPVQEPTSFELIVNLKTAKTLGLEVPATILGRADEVIE